MIYNPDYEMYKRSNRCVLMDVLEVLYVNDWKTIYFLYWEKIAFKL